MLVVDMGEVGQLGQGLSELYQNGFQHVRVTLLVAPPVFDNAGDLSSLDLQWRWLLGMTPSLHCKFSRETSARLAKFRAHQFKKVFKEANAGANL
ncbi:hypothetical protein D3C72_1906150 [compost metagenome]